MLKALSYQQVTLEPKFGIAPNRSSCDTSVDFLGKKFDLPIIPANMKCSIDFDKAEWCRDNNICYILHRFYPYDEIESWLNYNHHKLISISIGVQPEDIEFVKRIAASQSRVDFITIDVAHGYCQRVKNMLFSIQDLDWKRGKPMVIVGNIASAEAAEMFTDWGANALKVGIGQGHVCTTRLETGFGVPMYTCVKECAQATNIPIIADGGIGHFGDVAKAIHAGADMVMVGSMFARCIDSPAETIGNGWDTPIKKRWFGSASEFNKGNDRYVEGIERIESTNGLTYEQMFSKWKQAIESSISYAGGIELNSIRSCKIRELV